MSKKKTAQKPAEKKKMAVSHSALALFLAPEVEPVKYKIQRPELHPAVIPAAAKRKGSKFMALDAAVSSVYDYAGSVYGGMGFPGYPYLATLAQRSEYRSPSETTANEMTRKWIKIKSMGDGDLSEKIAKIETAMTQHKVRDLFRVAAEQDGFFGRSQIYIDIKGATDESRKLPLVVNRATIKKGSLKGFKNIEAMWTTPYSYNSDDPTAPDFFKPTQWFVMGKQTHASRLLTFVSREVPDMLKPAYNFGGMSLSQLMEPYVNAWLRTRDSISDLLHSFSLSGIKTDMSTVLQGGSGDDLLKRAKLFNLARDNRGLMLLDKESEEFFQFNTPLSGLDALQAQSQEHMAAPSHTPLVKLLGITPTGLNANSEGELQVYYDYINSMQENIFRDPLETVLKIIQLDLFGEIEEAIGFEFEPLEQMNGTELAAIRKSDADAGVAYISAGVISPEEERNRLASDPGSGYTSLDVEDLPEVVGDPDEKPDDGMPESGDSPQDNKEESISSTSLNGAQVTSMVDLAAKVSAGEISYENGLAIIKTAFSINNVLEKEIISLPKKQPAQDSAQSDFMVQFFKGFLEEQEHFDSVEGNEEVIARLVIDHLKKDWNYYTKAKKAGL